MNFEIRDGRLHLAGYVNAVERDSKVIMTARGRCVEQVAAGAFAASMADGHEIRMMLDHKRNIGTTTDGTLSLKEDNIGLYAEASTDDEELMMLAGKGELRGWSFGFVAKDDEIEERSGKEPRRRVKALDLQEVSILSVMPAYNGTSIECRSYDECALPEDVDIVDDGVDDVETVDTSAVDELRAYVELMKMKGYILRKREEQRALEMRYNHYHDPRTGQFASGKGGGMGLYYSMGKGRGEIVGASSKWNSPKGQTAAESEQAKEEIIASISIDGIKKKAQNAEGNWDWVNGTPISESEALSMEVDKVLEKGDGYTVIVGRVGNNFSYFATKNKDNPAVKRAKEKQGEKATKRKEQADKLQQDSIATQGKDKMTTSTGDRWQKKHRKDFDDWYFGSKGG